jgi:hypothetical protein
MLGKLLDACIWLDDDLMTTHFKLAEHAQLIIFCPVAWKKWVHENVSFRSQYDGQLQLCMSLLCDVTATIRVTTISARDFDVCSRDEMGDPWSISSGDLDYRGVTPEGVWGVWHPPPMFTNAILSGNLFKARAIYWARLPCFTGGKQRIDIHTFDVDVIVIVHIHNIH